MSTLSEYQRALNARRARRYFQSEAHKARRREFQQDLADLKRAARAAATARYANILAERQRQNDMAEDAGLPFASIIFNPYREVTQ